MSPLALRIAIVFTVVSSVGCTSLRRATGESTSVAKVLQRTRHIGAQLDEEAKLAGGFRPYFQRPLRNYRITSAFGLGGGRRHEGVDMRAPSGTPVYAAQEGIVVFAGDTISGYGDTVILRHPGTFSTLYAHNSELLVTLGERVVRGQCIAYSGNTGRSSAAHLHFEIRKGGRAMDPRPWISPQAIARGKTRSAEPPPVAEETEPLDNLDEIYDEIAREEKTRQSGAVDDEVAPEGDTSNLDKVK